MMREIFEKQNVGFNKEFRFRGEEPGRLENFSDAAFALAITLLLISTSPPTNFQQIKKFAWEIIPFSFCIALMVMIWYQHFTFFYRYGLRNSKVITLNSLFLIIVLFYVYPLKYLAKAILIPLSRIFNQDILAADLREMYGGANMPSLMIIYGIGATAVFATLTLMYRYALTKSEELHLNEIEKFDTRASIHANLVMAAIPLLSVVVEIFSSYAFQSPASFSGVIYFLYPVVMKAFWKRKGKQRRRFIDPPLINEPVAPPQFPVKEDLS